MQTNSILGFGLGLAAAVAFNFGNLVSEMEASSKRLLIQNQQILEVAAEIKSNFEKIETMEEKLRVDPFATRNELESLRLELLKEIVCI